MAPRSRPHHSPSSHDLADLGTLLRVACARRAKRADDAEADRLLASVAGLVAEFRRGQEEREWQTFAIHLVGGVAAIYARVKNDPSMSTELQEKELTALLVRLGFEPSDLAMESLSIEAALMDEHEGSAVDTAKSRVAHFMKASKGVGSEGTIESWKRKRAADVRWRVGRGRVTALPPPFAYGTTPSRKELASFVRAVLAGDGEDPT